MQSLEKIRLQNTPLKKVKKKVTTDSERESEKDMTLDVTAIYLLKIINLLEIIAFQQNSIKLSLTY